MCRAEVIFLWWLIHWILGTRLLLLKIFVRFFTQIVASPKRLHCFWNSRGHMHFCSTAGFVDLALSSGKCRNSQFSTAARPCSSYISQTTLSYCSRFPQGQVNSVTNRLCYVSFCANGSKKATASGFGPFISTLLQEWPVLGDVNDRKKVWFLWC